MEQPKTAIIGELSKKLLERLLVEPVHNCYGVGTEACSEFGLLEDGKPLKWESGYNPKDSTSKINKNDIINTTKKGE